MSSSAHAAVVMNEAVRYVRDTMGISMYHSNGSPACIVFCICICLKRFGYKTEKLAF